MRTLLIFVIALLGAQTVLAQQLVRERRPAMGTTVSVLLYAPSSEAAAPHLEAAFAEIERVEQLLSDYREDSELSRLNRATGPVTVDPEMLRLLNRALGWARQSGGAFDPTVGALMDSTDSPVVGWQHVSVDLLTREVSRLRDGLRLDAGAFGKGYALESAATVLREAGVTSALLSMGGSSYRALGPPPGARGWLIHVDDPTEGGTHATSVMLSQAGLSTSGNLERTHIMDPRTGQPATGCEQTTVIAPDAMDADILSTALCVLGPDAGEQMLGGLSTIRAWLIYAGTEHSEVRTIRWTSPSGS
ncbi:MAG: FAD:protein FMN transferase [Rhodothermales bacterium]|nr:FAD:protein FMN transferase [Rhodothermales bacterium]MBO6779977.1 FAD:protein FMN transferase [Rhodothermales bacterium]